MEYIKQEIKEEPLSYADHESYVFIKDAFSVKMDIENKFYKIIKHEDRKNIQVKKEESEDYPVSMTRRKKKNRKKNRTKSSTKIFEVMPRPMFKYRYVRRGCNICLLNFHTFNDFNEHLFKVHRKYQCRFCLYRVTHLHKLYNHIYNVHKHVKTFNISSEGRYIYTYNFSFKPPNGQIDINRVVLSNQYNNNIIIDLTADVPKSSSSKLQNKADKDNTTKENVDVDFTFKPVMLPPKKIKSENYIKVEFKQEYMEMLKSETRWVLNPLSLGLSNNNSDNLFLNNPLPLATLCLISMDNILKHNRNKVLNASLPLTT